MQLKTLHILMLLVQAGYVQAQFVEKTFDNIKNKEEYNSNLYGHNQFKNGSSFDVSDSVVSFFLRENKEAKRVFLVGSFSNWIPEANPMNNTDSGWVAFVKLVPGKYTYKFLIDDKWAIDNDNLLSESNGQGSFSSIYYKTNAVFTLPGFAKAKGVYLAASFNNWRAAELSLSKTTSGWEIPLYVSDGRYGYKFKADDGWHEDPGNRNRLPDKSGDFISLIIIGTPIPDKENLAYLQNELAMHERSGTRENLIDDLVNLGNGYMRQHDYPNAIQSFQRVVILYEELKNHAGMADMQINIADAYRELSDFPHLLEYLQKAAREYEKAGNESGLAKTLRSTGYYYLNVSYVRAPAIPYFQKSLVLYKKSGKLKEVSYLLGDLGHTYLLVGDTVAAFKHIQQAIDISQQIGNKQGMAKFSALLCAYYSLMTSDIPQALECFQKALKLFEETGNKVGIAQILLGRAELYNKASDSALKRIGIPLSEIYARAIEDEKKALQIFKELLPESEQLYPLSTIYQTYDRIGKFDTAYYYYKEYIIIRDRVTGTEKQKDIVRLETKYEYEKREDSLKFQQELTNEKLQSQLLLATHQQQVLELNQSELALTNKEKDLQYLAFLKSQSDLKNERLIKQQKEKENQLQTVQVRSLTQKNKIIQLKVQGRRIYIIGGFILLVAGSMYFIYRSRLRSVRLESQLLKEKAALEKKEAEFQHKLADVSMSALRSQMNPHFIFNCLNSIKLYTTQNDSVAASEYLTKFSRLIRLILENSRSERITLSSELAALELYIEMEAMRFKEKLSYSISVEKNVEPDYIEIPPLLLQPYVENAIWHGLMPRDEGGHIVIAVKMQEESTLVINIADNGIGRTAASNLKNKTIGKHKSYGMKATTERIELINQIYKTGASVSVHDPINEDGYPAGTRVTIQIPV